MKTIIDLLERKLEQRTKELNTQEEIFYTNSCKSYHRYMFRDAIDVNRVFISECTRALSILKSENSVGVSDASAEDGALARDREWNESGENAGRSIASEHVPIGNRISDENLCEYCKKKPIDDYYKPCCGPACYRLLLLT